MLILKTAWTNSLRSLNRECLLNKLTVDKVACKKQKSTIVNDGAFYLDAVAQNYNRFLSTVLLSIVNFFLISVSPQASTNLYRFASSLAHNNNDI